MASRLLLWVAFMLALPVGAQAQQAQQECNPLDIKDLTFAYQDTWTQINYEHDTNINQQGSTSSSGGIDFFDVAKLTGETRETI